MVKLNDVKKQTHLICPKSEDDKNNLISLTECSSKEEMGLSLTKRPGWRLSPNYHKLYSSSPSVLQNYKSLLDSAKSDTSISSRGRLKEFIISNKRQICHKVNYKFQFDSKLLHDAEKMAETLASIKSLDELSSRKIKQNSSFEFSSKSNGHNSLLYVKVFNEMAECKSNSESKILTPNTKFKGQK